MNIFRTNILTTLLKFVVITSVFLGAKIAFAHVGIPTAPTTSCGSLDSVDFKTHTSNQIENRLTGLSTTTSMKIYSVRGDSETPVGATTTPWTRNTNVWSNRGTPVDLTGLNAWTQMYNGYSGKI